MPRRSPSPRTEPLGPGRLDSYLFYWIGHIDNLYKRSIVAALKPMRITIAWWRALAVLMERDGATVTELADITVIERTALTRVIDQMAKRGLVRRQVREGDRRVIEIHLTPEGRALHARILPAAEAAYRRATDGMSPREIAAMIAALKQMRGRFGGP
ncbi:MAG: MarR family transcriptional regulator [Rhodospirillaceae bacterium]|nr:MarR family transcriptional regulator [Rhodospirillaceae bacterium]